MSNLRPYHAFEIDGCHYVYSVWGMSYRKASVQIIAELAKVRDGEATEPGPETRQIIKELGLRWSDKVRSIADLADKDRAAVAAAREKPPAISQLELFVTQDCNMRCPYCYGDGGGYGGGGPMSEPTALRAVDWLIRQAGDSKTLNISFFGGEPLLNFGLVEKVIAYTRETIGTSSKIGFSVTSNLSLLDDRILDALVSNGIKVFGSLDGPRHIQSRNRPLKNGRDSYEAVAPKVRRLLRAIPNATGRATLAAGDDPWEVTGELLAFGFRHIHIQPTSGCLVSGNSATSGCDGPGPCPHDALVDLYRGMASRFREAIAKRNAEKARTVLSTRNLARHVPLFLNQRDVLRAMAKRRSYFLCSRALTMVAVAANGDIYPCHRFVGAKAFCMGNVHTGEFKRDDFVRSAVVENRDCALCWARYVCGGNCQHDNAAATGDPLRPRPCSCRELRARIESAIHIADCLGSEELDWLAELGIIENQNCRVDF